MLSVKEINDHLALLSYKPGWKFTAYQGRWEGMHVVITTVVDDAFKPGEKVTLDVNCFLSHNDIESTDTLEKWLAYRLARIEVHEMREFLKKAGKVIDSPHAEFADRDL